MRKHRDVGPFLQLFRRLVRGRKYVSALRFADELAARTQPPPNIPGGPYHRLTKMYYHTRDARRLVTPPIEIPTANLKQIGAGSAIEPAKMIPRTPNKVYDPPCQLEPPKSSVYNEPFEL